MILRVRGRVMESSWVMILQLGEVVGKLLNSLLKMASRSSKQTSLSEFFGLARRCGR